MAETRPNLDVFHILKHLKLILFWKLHFTNHFYYELQVFTVCFMSTCVYINVKADIISDGCCTFC